MENLELAREIIDIVSDVKGEDIVLLDIQDVTTIADYFVICTANSDRQLKAIAERVVSQLKEDHAVRPYRVEGEAEGGWVLMDYSSVVVHAFSAEMRDYYALEEFWSAGKTLVRMQ